MLVIIYAPPDMQTLDLAAICEVLATANQAARAPPHYEVRIVAGSVAPLRGSSGLTIVPDGAIATAFDPPDLLIIGATGNADIAPAAETLAWLRRQASAAARFGSIGNGAFLLGAAGLLDGRRVTTHWAWSKALIRACPAARVEPDLIFVRDGRLFSCAGAAATLDLMLSLIEDDHGREFALELARHFILFIRRSGTQAQVSVQLATQVSARDPIQRVQKHVRDHLGTNLSATAMAAIAAMSPRNFARVFLHETGMRPTDYVEQTRVNLAKRMLEESALSLQEVARLCGFSSTEAARRAFQRREGTTMSGYRAQLLAKRDD